MDKVREFFRKTMFYARVISGYEERRIRSYRMQLQQRLQQVEARKAAINKLPEQIILSEVRKMVEEMRTLNKKLEDTEAAIEDYFKPIDMEAEMLMKAQLEGEEKTMRMMVMMQRQALLEKAEADAQALANSQNSQNSEADQRVEEAQPEPEPEPAPVDKNARMR